MSGDTSYDECMYTAHTHKYMLAVFEAETLPITYISIVISSYTC